MTARTRRIALVASVLSLALPMVAAQPPATAGLPPALRGLTASPISFSLQVAQTGRVQASVQKNRPEVVAPIVFGSSDSTVARVDSTGVVTALKPGSATVTVKASAAASAGLSAASLTVAIRVDVAAAKSP